MTYLYSRGIHQYLTDNINAPLYDYATNTFIIDPCTGQPSCPSRGKAICISSSPNGVYRQDQLITSVNARARNYSVSGFYVLGSMKSDTSGANYFPSRQDDIAFDYGRSSNDVRNRFFLLATTILPYGIQGSIFTIANAGAPYNITTGQDLNRDNQYNERPSVVDASLCTPGSMQYYATRYGCLNITPNPGETDHSLWQRARAGELQRQCAAEQELRHRAEAGGTWRWGGDGGPHGGGVAVRRRRRSSRRTWAGRVERQRWWRLLRRPELATVRRKYNLNFTVAANNVFNVVNLAQPSNVVSSQNFDKSLALAGSFFNRNQTSVRTIDLQMSFSF